MKTSTLKRCSAAVVLGLMAVLPGYLSLQVSAEGLRLITDFEGCQLQPYQCSAGVWTSGIGHTAGVKPAQTITEHQAAENLLADIQQTERTIKKCMPVTMPQPVFTSAPEQPVNPRWHFSSTSSSGRKLVISSRAGFSLMVNVIAGWNAGEMPSVPSA